jgi:hypothetical protein
MVLTYRVTFAMELFLLNFRFQTKCKALVIIVFNVNIVLGKIKKTRVVLEDGY